MEGWISVSPDSKFFDHELQGTWQTNGISDYSGTLVITTNSIRISGYAPNSLYELTHGINHRPFRNFVKDTALEGYSEESKIFIKDGGNWQDGIPYTYWDSYPPPDFRRIQFLRFQFGGRFETLQKIN
jgi:hypothetical protein